ncbi:hypothetical protein VTP01DRAFT_7092 [Rhizomucor pusillus]|uniref:uncharacterized protein n=1 Tax=Rhizomucor pusillus TaxID=4840 RepID=UPI003743A39D
MSTTVDQTPDQSDELSSEQINSLAASVEEELKKFKLESYYSERLASALHDYEGVYDKVCKGSVQIIDVACDVEKIQNKQEVQKLEDDLRDIIDIQQRLQDHKNIYDSLIARLRSGAEHMSDIVGEYERQWALHQSRYNAMSDKMKYGSSDYMKDFKQSVWDVNHPNEPMPENDGDEDTDIVIGRAKESFKCPITQTWLEEPVTSKSCKHTFSKRAIITYIQRRGARAECPIPGCSAMLTVRILENDPLVERKVIRAKAQEKTDNVDDYYDVDD